MGLRFYASWPFDSACTHVGEDGSLSYYQCDKRPGTLFARPHSWMPTDSNICAMVLRRGVPAGTIVTIFCSELKSSRR